MGLDGVDRAIDLSMKQTFERYVFYSYNPLNNLTCTKPTAYVNVSALLCLRHYYAEAIACPWLPHLQFCYTKVVLCPWYHACGCATLRQ